MNKEVYDATNLSQPGLFIEPEFATFFSCKLAQKLKQDPKFLLEKCRQIQDLAKVYQPQSFVILGFAPRVSGTKDLSYIINNSPKLVSNNHDILVYVKSENQDTHKIVCTKIAAKIKEIAVDKKIINSSKRHDGKVIGGRFLDGIRNPHDPITMTEHVISRNKLGEPNGASYCFTQEFLYNWDAILSKSKSAQEDIIGREFNSNIIPENNPDRHIKKARVYDKSGNAKLILRQSLPFGESATGAGNEEGLMFVAFAKNLDIFEEILKNMLGSHTKFKSGSEFVDDSLMRVVQGLSGGYWYIPSAQELSMSCDGVAPTISSLAIFDIRSVNNYMFYNTDDYLRAMTSQTYEAGDKPSNRILSLLSQTFYFWQNKWYKPPRSPYIPHLKNYLNPDEKYILEESTVIRKGMAIRKTLEIALVTSNYAKEAELYKINSKDIIVGSMPFLSLGTGKQVMPYLREDEKAASFVKSINEFSSMGHVVPGYEIILQLGLKNFIAKISNLRESAQEKSQKEFYSSCILALQGIQAYLNNFSALAQKMSNDMSFSAWEKDNLVQISSRMAKLSQEAPQDFLEAAQLVFSLHCCLHIIGEPVAIGRLDQILFPFLKNSNISQDQAQEIIDSFWIKLGEKVLLNNHFAPDTLTYGTTAVAFQGGNFPQGGGLNQWVQQITVGGILPNDDEESTGGCNLVTQLCLKSSRRLPLNAPCLSLRLYPDMPKEVIYEAAKCILSGGAHPILLNDKKIIHALEHSGNLVSKKSARNYACDGCYEPMFAGQNEFSFSNIALLDLLEFSLNQGALYKDAGPVHLRGLVNSYSSPCAEKIKDFNQLQDIFLSHLEYQVINFYADILGKYGSLYPTCPSPLLSNFIAGCLEQGRDLTNGGAKYHILAPMFVGMSFAADSLFAIKKLVFDPKSAVTTLPELLLCLKCDWGFDMKEPMISTHISPERRLEQAARFKYLREQALSLPKFGMGDSEADQLAWWITKSMCQTSLRVLREPDKLRFPAENILNLRKNIEKNYGSGDFPFEFQVTPGVGTFEGYIGDGLPSGASADGRRSGAPLASDFSPSPSPQDLPASPRYSHTYKALSSYDNEWINFGVANCAPVDMNIREDYGLENLVKLISSFSQGRLGSNLLTITCANEETYQQASKYPERYNLIRVRMGGWSEFYITMFDAHQRQHQRRQYFMPDKTS